HGLQGRRRDRTPVECRAAYRPMHTPRRAAVLTGFRYAASASSSTRGGAASGELLAPRGCRLRRAPRPTVAHTHHAVVSALERPGVRARPAARPSVADYRDAGSTRAGRERIAAGDTRGHAA